MRVTLCAAATLALFGFGQIALAADPISQADMEKAFKGKSFKDDGSGNIGVISYGDDMTIKIVVPSGPQSPQDTGTYRFANGGYCSKWAKNRNGAEGCFTATKTDAGYQLWTNPGGKKDDTLTPQ